MSIWTDDQGKTPAGDDIPYKYEGGPVAMNTPGWLTLWL